MRAAAAALFVTLIAVVSGCGDDEFSSNGTTIVQEPPPAPPVGAPPVVPGSAGPAPAPAHGPAGPGFRAPAGLAEAVAFDDDRTLEVTSCEITTSTEPGTQYELTLTGGDLFEVMAGPDDVVTRVSALAPSPDRNSTEAGGTLEGTVLTGTAVFAPGALEWDELAFAFDTGNCT